MWCLRKERGEVSLGLFYQAPEAHVRVDDIAGHLATISGLAGAFWLHRSRKRTLLGDRDDNPEDTEPIDELTGDADTDALLADADSIVDDERERVFEPVGSAAAAPDRISVPAPSN